jgi:hypothetical protein
MLYIMLQYQQLEILSKVVLNTIPPPPYNTNIENGTKGDHSEDTFSVEIITRHTIPKSI